MTTAHRPTFAPARGKDDLKGPAYHQRLLPAHTQLKFRKPGQGGAPDAASHSRDLRAELEAAEAAHFAKARGTPLPSSEPTPSNESSKRPLALTVGEADEEDAEAKRRKILEETRDIDADDTDDSEEADDDDDSDSDSDSDDEEAELQRELERVRRERAEKREKEERERAAAEQEARERDIALGNPLLNKAADFSIKRRWDDDVVFKNQARGTDDKGKKKEFVNVSFTPDFLGRTTHFAWDGGKANVLNRTSCGRTFISGLWASMSGRLRTSSLGYGRGVMGVCFGWALQRELETNFQMWLLDLHGSQRPDSGTAAIFETY